MRLQRLLKMGIDELAGRTQQEASKWLEQVGIGSRTNGHPHAVFGKLGRELPRLGVHALVREGNLAEAGRMLCECFREMGPSRFFEGAVNPETPLLLAEQMPGFREEVLAAAEADCQKRFDLLGYRGLSFGDPVDWHLDPISGRRAPLVHWGRLDPLDSENVGDSKVVWELNRHQWFLQLGQAYLLTGDERYAEAWAGFIRAWIRANPPGMGINWASSLEVALRLMSWCWALYLFRSSPALSPELFVAVLEAMWAHASHVERYLSHYHSPNTHLTGEALGLLYAGVVLPELRPAKRWRELGARILVEQIERQVLADGVYFEQSTCYQRYTVEIYLQLLVLAAKNGIPVPASVGERVQDMLDFLVAVARPDGSMPQIGDGDGGCLLPLKAREPDDYRGTFSTAAALFGRSDYSWAAGGLAPETLWLLGPGGWKSFAGLRPAPPAAAPSRLFPDGGYAVMRSDWGPEGHQLIFDVGPLGCPVSGGHGHADLLSIQCSVFGEPYLVDAGTYCYAADRAGRDHFRSTAAHSTVRVDGADQAVPAGPFQWQARPRARLRRWHSTEPFDMADAEHDAYERLAHPVTHRRRILFVKPRCWVVVDDLKGAAVQRVDLQFQFAPIEVTMDPGLWARARGTRGRGLLLRVFATVPLKADIIQGGLTPIQGWVSPDYGQRRPAPLLTYSAVTRLPLRIVTLLVPVADPLEPAPTVSAVRGDGPGPVGLVFWDGQGSILFDDRDFVIIHPPDLAPGLAPDLDRERET